MALALEKSSHSPTPRAEVLRTFDPLEVEAAKVPKPGLWARLEGDTWRRQRDEASAQLGGVVCLVAVRASSGQRQLHAATTEIRFAAGISGTLVTGVHSRDGMLDVPSASPRTRLPRGAARNLNQLLFREAIRESPMNVQIWATVTPLGSDVGRAGVLYGPILDDANCVDQLPYELVVFRGDTSLRQRLG